MSEWQLNGGPGQLEASGEGACGWSSTHGAWFSPQVPQALGFSPAEWSLETLLTLLDDEERARVVDLARRVVAGARCEVLTVRVRDRQGQEHAFSVATVLSRDEQGRVKDAVAFVRQLDAHDTLATKVRRVAHDLNNLFSIMTTSVALADLQMDRGRVGEVRSSLKSVTSAVDRSVGMLRDLRGWVTSRTSGKRRKVDLNALVEPLLATAQLRAVLSPRLPPVLCDEARLRRALADLFTQCRAASGTASLLVETSHRRDDGGKVVVCVRASPESEAGALLHVDQAQWAAPIAAEGGTVDLQPGVVTVLLPAVGARVLLVDDEALVRRGAARLLSHLGCQVLEVSNGQEALDTLASRGDGFDLVLMDVSMPVMDGRAAAQAIRSRWPQLEVVLSSGHVEARDASLPDGIRFLPKPWSVDDLGAMLAALTAR